MTTTTDKLVQRRIRQLERFIEKKDTLRRTHPLRYLFWEATLRCNLNCLHCGSDCVCDNSTEADELSVETVKAELRAIAAVYPPERITFAIIGGEPLVRKQAMLEVGAYANDLGYHWGITTNGMLLDQKTILQLKAAGLQTISVSLDGLQPQHDALRNCQGAYPKVISAVETLLSDRFWRKFDVICCVSRINIHTLSGFLQSLRDLGLPAVRFTPVFSRGRAVQNSQLMLKDQDYRYLLKFVAENRAEFDDIDISLSEEGYWGPEWESRIRKSLHYCASGIQIGSILYNGDIIGCPSMSRAFVQGNLQEASFVETWQTRFQLYRQGRKEIFSGQCGDCDHWELCEGGGLHLLQPDGITPNQCCLRKINEKKISNNPERN